jgi:hypothetical protein
MRRQLSTLFLCAASLGLAVLSTAGQEAAPNGLRPKAYSIRIRYRIDAPFQQRYNRYQEMLRHLESYGFKKEKGLEGEELYGDTLSGTAPADNVDKLTQQRFIRTAVLVPEGFKAADDKPVLVDLRLPVAAGTARQMEIAAKAREQLKPLNFNEAVGYDAHHHQRIVGWLPFGQLAELLKPGPAPEALTPIFRAEVLREPDGAEPPKEPQAAEPPAPDRPNLAKVAPELRKRAEGGDQKPERVEVVLWQTPAAGQDWLSALTPYVRVDGRMGPFVFGTLLGGGLDGLTSLPEVAAVRLAQAARPLVLPPPDESKPGPLPLDFIALGRPILEIRKLEEIVGRRAPQKLAVIAHDFHGYQGLVGKGLPARTNLLDFTGIRNDNLHPEPLDEGAGLGDGTRLALALASQFKLDELFLVRIPVDAAYDVEQVARVVQGQAWASEAYRTRDQELYADRLRLEELRLQLRVRRRLALSATGEDEASKLTREEYRKLQAEYETALASYNDRLQRFNTLFAQMRQLRGVGTVVLGLNWVDAYPTLPGQVPALRYLDPNVRRGAAWIQALPRRPGQTWTDYFRDADQDRAMEFAATANPGARSEINYLAWKPTGEKVTPLLPAKAVVQVTLQWQEAQNPEWKKDAAGDAYRKPLAPLQVVILKQRDPAGKVLPPDIYEVVERTTFQPVRLESDAHSAIYQIQTRFQVGDQPGRYAVRIEGEAPLSDLPPGVGRLPGAFRGELRPKLTVAAWDPESRQQGSVVLENFTTGE